MPENKVAAVIEVEIEADVAAKEWDKRLKEFEGQTVAALRKEVEKYEKAIKQTISSTTKLSKAQAASVKEFRTTIDQLKDVIKTTTAKEKADAKAAKAVSPEQIQAVADAWEAQRAEVAKYVTTVDQARVEIQKTRDEIRTLRTSQIADADATKAVIAEKRQYLTVLQSLLGQLQQQEQAIKQVTRAEEQQAKGAANSIKKLLTWGAGVASVYYLYRKFRNELVETFKAVYENTKEYENVTKAIEKLKLALLLAVFPADETRGAMQKLADFMENASKAAALFGAAMAGVNAAYRELRDAGDLPNWTIVFGPLAGLLDVAAGGFHALKGDIDPVKTAIDRFNAALIDAANTMDAAGEEAEDYSNIIDKLVAHMRSAADAQREINEAFAQAGATYRSAIAIAQGNLARDILQINIDLEKEIAKINQDALDARADAYDDYRDQIARAQQQAQKQERDDLARHQLEMEFARRRHQLTQIQNERVYQYERSRLVAEGDVLAIEDLDARYELERKAAEENFQLQMEQAEALFRLQAKIQAEAMRDQIRELQAALQKQLRAIEESRRDRIDEAEEQAEEERRAAKATYADQLADAQAAYEEAKEEKRKAEEEQLKDTAEFLAEYAIEHDLALKDVLEAWQKVNGKNGELTKEAQAAYNEIVLMTELFSRQIMPIMKKAGEQAGLAYKQGIIAAMAGGIMLPGVNTTRGGRPSNRDGPGPVSSFQYGGEAIYSQPTNIQVGHGPERVIVQPLTSLGGNYNVNLGGRAVIEGQGQFNGMDMAAVNATVNDALHSAFTTFMRSRQNIKGKRGW